MSTQALIDKLRWLRSEVLALKQSATKALGTAEFYSQELSGLYYFGASSYTFEVTIQFSGDVDEVPFTQVYFSNSSMFSSYGGIWDPDSNTLTFNYSIDQGGFSFDIDTKVVTSRPIVNLTAEALGK